MKEGLNNKFIELLTGYVRENGKLRRIVFPKKKVKENYLKDKTDNPPKDISPNC